MVQDPQAAVKSLFYFTKHASEYPSKCEKTQSVPPGVARRVPKADTEPAFEITEPTTLINSKLSATGINHVLRAPSAFLQIEALLRSEQEGSEASYRKILTNGADTTQCRIQKSGKQLSLKDKD